VCTCPTSYANLKECIGELEDEKTRAVINMVLKAVNYEYKGGVTVYHGAEMLYAMKESLTKRATLSLIGLMIATHHGCHYLKVFYDEVISGSWEYPTLLDEIRAAFFGTPVDYSERSLCCGMGFSHFITSSDYTESIALLKLESILAEEPDVIVTMCGACQAVLDYFQKRFEKKFERVAPVLNVSQLVEILLGADTQRDLAIQFAAVDVLSLLKKIKTI
jgi:heterodisulfide reductase subunit B1